MRLKEGPRQPLRDLLYTPIGSSKGQMPLVDWVGDYYQKLRKTDYLLGLYMGAGLLKAACGLVGISDPASALHGVAKSHIEQAKQELKQHARDIGEGLGSSLTPDDKGEKN